MSLYDLPWASYKFHAFTYAFLKWIQFKMLNKDTRKLPQFFCFRVRGFFSVKLRLDTNRNFALRGTTLPTCTQPAPILLPSLQLPSFSTLWDLPIYFLFTVRATYCNNLQEPEGSIRLLPCLFTLLSSFQQFHRTVHSKSSTESKNHTWHTLTTDNLQASSFWQRTNRREQRVLPVWEKQYTPVKAYPNPLYSAWLR